VAADAGLGLVGPDVLVQAWRASRRCGERAAAVGLERLSLAWSSAEDDGREIKRLLYILVFLLAFPLLAQLGLGRIRQLLLLGSALLAIAALVSIIKFYGLQRMPC
jgi:hypothetical protein